MIRPQNPNMHTADLWVQDRLRAKNFRLTKVLGTLIPADVLTKHVERKVLEQHLHRLAIEEESGRAASAPTLEHVDPNAVTSILSLMTIRV